jgi:hypothetical protein
MKNSLFSISNGVFAAFALIVTACGTSTTGGTATYSHVVIERFGLYGYYSGTTSGPFTGQFCDYMNNYCETGLSYGITDNGCSYLGGNACYYSETGVDNGGVGYTPTVVPTPAPYVPTYPSYGSSGFGSSGSSGSGYAVEPTTKDIDLQRAQLAQQDLQDRAQMIATQYQMSLEGALELTQLSDTMQKLTAQNKFTGEDQLAISQAALSVAGIGQVEFQVAMANYLNNHDQNAFNAIIDHGAQHLGMPSSAALRDQILPSLGLNVNQL